MYKNQKHLGMMLFCFQKEDKGITMGIRRDNKLCNQNLFWCALCKTNNLWKGQREKLLSNFRSVCYSLQSATFMICGYTINQKRKTY